MKLNFGKRLLLFVHWLLSLIGCALAALLMIIPDTVNGWLARAYALMSKRTFDTIGIVVIAVYVLVTIGTVLVIFSGSKRRESRGFITVDSSDSGTTRIAISAVDGMIRRAMSGIEGIGDVKATIENHDDAISIHTTVTILRDVHVPTVTMNIQRAVRAYIEQNCGVAVRQVSVSVKAVESDGSAPAVKYPAPKSVGEEAPGASTSAVPPQVDSYVAEETPGDASDIPVLTLHPDVDADGEAPQSQPEDAENE